MAEPFDEIVVSAKIAEKICQHPILVSHLQNKLDFNAALNFYRKRYVVPLMDFTEITADTTIVDAGAGSGWLAFAIALSTPAKVIAVEPQQDLVQLGQDCAQLLGIADRVDYRCGSLGSPLPLRDAEADITMCIEVLEHVNRSPAAVRDLCRVSKEWIVLTTPNLQFPAVAHDTRLPFAHWMPIPMRKAYARVAGKNPNMDHNLFWSAAALDKLMPEFERKSSFLHYKDLQAFSDTHPFYMPYDHGYWVKQTGTLKKNYYKLVSKMFGGNPSLLPNIAGTFQRKK